MGVEVYVPQRQGSDASAWSEIAGYEDLKKVGLFPRFDAGNPRLGAAVDSVPREILRDRAEDASKLLESHSARSALRRTARNRENVDRAADRAGERVDFDVRARAESEAKTHSAGEHREYVLRRKREAAEHDFESVRNHR